MGCLLNTVNYKKIENNYYPLGQWGLLWRVPPGTCIIIYRVPRCKRSVYIYNALYVNLK